MASFYPNTSAPPLRLEAPLVLREVLYTGTSTQRESYWTEQLGLGVCDWEYSPRNGVSCQMRRRYPIGVGGVLSEIGLMTMEKGDPRRVRESALRKGLQWRFRTTPAEAKEAIDLAILFGSIRRAPAGWIRVR